MAGSVTRTITTNHLSFLFKFVILDVARQVISTFSEPQHAAASSSVLSSRTLEPRPTAVGLTSPGRTCIEVDFT